MSNIILSNLDTQLADGNDPMATCKRAIRQAGSELAARFLAGEDVVALVRERASFTDAILQRAWHHHMPHSCNAALIAVGGYGRGELHPASDVDVLILTDQDPQQLACHLEPLVMFLWDIGLEVGHSVRSLSQCVEEASADITVATNLMESRLLAGEAPLFQAMRDATGPDRIWPSARFFSAKCEEQRARHAKYDDSVHNLEPNIKGSPGGLRDIQMIGWVAKRHFGADTMADLVTHGFLSDHEYRRLRQGEEHLWRIRFALHTLTGRHEDRLLFEYQRTLAKQFGYSDENTNLAVEQFMQAYYRRVVELQRLNEMLLQLFQEAILSDREGAAPIRINRRFQARNGYLEVINQGTFARYPLAMLEVSLILQQHPELQGVCASTIRSIRAHRHLIDARFRRDIRARSLFLEILRQPNGITHEMRRMHRYGILGRYLPMFGKITGLMQFDLFHVYTVDEHILMVVRNLRRFAIDKHADECPRCNQVFRQIPKPEILYLAGLFHDIAKGRGGDHSELGAHDAYTFCRAHALSEYDSRLVAWLVEKHLVMSKTAQHTDIDDPEVIQTFARTIGTQQRLDHLYLLSVADMRGTNPKRWNSWKNALLDSLYNSTSRAIARGLDQPTEENELIQQSQAAARSRLHTMGADNDTITAIWMGLSTDYFLQNSTVAIVWHTDLLLDAARDISRVSVHFRDAQEHGCTELFLFGPDRDDLFAHTTALLDQLGLNILGARVQSTPQGRSINSYYILEEDGSTITGEPRKNAIRFHLEENIANPDPTQLGIVRRVPRHLKAFPVASEIRFEQDNNRHLTTLHLKTGDKPGLLSRIGAVFAEHRIRLHSARIATIGAEAQDSFAMTDRTDRPLTDPAVLDALAATLHRRLES